MSLALVEALGSGNLARGTERQGERKFFVTGVAEPPTSSTDASVAAFVEANSPATFDGMGRRAVRVEQVAAGIWRATCTYAPAEARPPSEYEGFLTTFSTNGGSETVYLAKTQTRMALDSADPTTATDHGLQIGVTPDGEVEGVDIVVPKFEFSETHYRPLASVNNAYALTLMGMTGAVNRTPFRQFPAKSVLFLGASGGIRPAEQDWEMTYSFAVSPNASLTVAKLLGDAALPYGQNQITKAGHDYLWMAYRKELGEQTQEFGRVTVRPIAAYVATVYPDADFAALGIGGT